MANENNLVLGAATISLDGVDVGHTMGGATVRYDSTLVEMESDQSNGVVRLARSGEKMFVTFTLQEMTLANLRRAFMLPAASLVGSTLTLGYNGTCWMDEPEIVLVGPSPSCGTRTITLDRCSPTAKSKEYKMMRTEQSVMELEYMALKNSSGNFGTIVDT